MATFPFFGPAAQRPDSVRFRGAMSGFGSERGSRIRIRFGGGFRSVSLSEPQAWFNHEEQRVNRHDKRQMKGVHACSNGEILGGARVAVAALIKELQSSPVGIKDTSEGHYWTRALYGAWVGHR